MSPNWPSLAYLVGGGADVLIIFLISTVKVREIVDRERRIVVFCDTLLESSILYIPSNHVGDARDSNDGCAHERRHALPRPGSTKHVDREGLTIDDGKQWGPKRNGDAKHHNGGVTSRFGNSVTPGFPNAVFRQPTATVSIGVFPPHAVDLGRGV